MHRNINKVKLICKGNMRRSLFLSTMGTFLFAFNCDKGMNDFHAKAIQNRLHPDLKLLNNPSADYFSCSSSIKEEQDRGTVYNGAIQQVADSNPSKMPASVVAVTDGLEYPRIISQKKSDNDIGLLVDDNMDCEWGDSDLSGSFIKGYQDNSAVQQVADSNSSKMSQTVVPITDGLENSRKVCQKKADNEIGLLVDDNTDLEWDDSGFNDSFSGVKNLEWDNSDFSGSLCENEIIVESDDSNDSILKALDKPSDLFSESSDRVENNQDEDSDNHSIMQNDKQDDVYSVPEEVKDALERRLDPFCTLCYDFPDASVSGSMNQNQNRAVA